jgi:hypothetical protein
MTRGEVIVLEIERRATEDACVMNFVADRLLNAHAPLAFYDREAGLGDEMAAAFFEIEGVEGLMVINDMCKVRIGAGASWDDVGGRVEEVMRRAWTGGKQQEIRD